jgi:hypothetical protein
MQWCPMSDSTTEQASRGSAVASFKQFQDHKRRIFMDPGYARPIFDTFGRENGHATVSLCMGMITKLARPAHACLSLSSLPMPNLQLSKHL